MVLLFWGSIGGAVVPEKISSIAYLDQTVAAWICIEGGSNNLVIKYGWNEEDFVALSLEKLPKGEYLSVYLGSVMSGREYRKAYIVTTMGLYTIDVLNDMQRLREEGFRITSINTLEGTFIVREVDMFIRESRSSIVRMMATKDRLLFYDQQQQLVMSRSISSLLEGEDITGVEIVRSKEVSASDNKRGVTGGIFVSGTNSLAYIPLTSLYYGEHCLDTPCFEGATSACFDSLFYDFSSGAFEGTKIAKAGNTRIHGLNRSFLNEGKDKGVFLIVSTAHGPFVRNPDGSWGAFALLEPGGRNYEPSIVFGHIDKRPRAGNWSMWMRRSCVSEVPEHEDSIVRFPFSTDRKNYRQGKIWPELELSGLPLASTIDVTLDDYDEEQPVPMHGSSSNESGSSNSIPFNLSAGQTQLRSESFGGRRRSPGAGHESPSKLRSTSLPRINHRRTGSRGSTGSFDRAPYDIPSPSRGRNNSTFTTAEASRSSGFLYGDPSSGGDMLYLGQPLLGSVSPSMLSISSLNLVGTQTPPTSSDMVNAAPSLSQGFGGHNNIASVDDYHNCWIQLERERLREQELVSAGGNMLMPLDFDAGRPTLSTPPPPGAVAIPGKQEQNQKQLMDWRHSPASSSMVPSDRNFSLLVPPAIGYYSSYPTPASDVLIHPAHLSGSLPAHLDDRGPFHYLSPPGKPDAGGYQ